MTTPDHRPFAQAVLAAYEPMIRHMAKEIFGGPTVFHPAVPRVDTSWIDEAPIEELAHWLSAVLDDD